MLLGEPPQSQADVHFSLFGIPVRIHPFFWLVGALLTPGGLLNAADLQAMLIAFVPWIIAFSISILVHELGHAFMMRRYGFSPNITLYGLGGLTSFGPSGQYNTRGHGTLPQVLISVAGPGIELLLAVAVIAAIKLSGHTIEFAFGGKYGLSITGMSQIGSVMFTEFLYYLVTISIIWAVINLLPIYPLDGGQISRDLLLAVNPRNGIQWSLTLSAIGGAAVAVVGLVLWRSFWTALLFGYLAYMSYSTLQRYTNRNQW